MFLLSSGFFPQDLLIFFLDFNVKYVTIYGLIWHNCIHRSFCHLPPKLSQNSGWIRVVLLPCVLVQHGSRQISREGSEERGWSCSSVTKKSPRRKGSEPVWETQKLKGCSKIEGEICCGCCIMWLFCPCRGCGILEISIKTLRSGSFGPWCCSIMGCSLMEPHPSGGIFWATGEGGKPSVRRVRQHRGTAEHQDMVDVVNHGMMQDDENRKPWGPTELCTLIWISHEKILL